MAKQSLNRVLLHLRQVAAVQTYRTSSDRELLERFVGGHDEAAFTVLIERHGPMVLGVCRRALPNFHDAEDACQATFLVLARRAGSVRKKASLSSWLHGVACRVAAKLTRDYARRKRRERRVDSPAPKDPAAEVTWREVQAVLDEELLRLPDRYRAPLILCYLECMTRDEAAQQLGLSSGRLHGRLQRARDLLREHLTQRGLTLSAVMSAAALGESVAQAALAPTFVVSSTKAALLLAAGQPLAPSVVATNVLALTQEVVKNMFLTKLKLGTAAALCAGLVVAMIGGSFTSWGSAQEAKSIPLPAALALDFGFPTEKTESDLDFIKRISKDLRGSEPTPAEIHFFVANKDPGRRQKLIDLFNQERKAEKEAAERQDVYNHALGYAAVKLEMYERTPGLGTLQIEFCKELYAAKEKGDIAKVTQAHRDRLIDFVKTNPKSQAVPEAMRQIIWVYESQGKTVEAGAWRDKLQKEHTKGPSGAAPKAIDKEQSKAKSPDSDRTSSFNIGDVTYTLPFAIPSAEEILRALPGTARPKNARIQCDLLVYQLDPVRVFPGVGNARLAHVHFKCTIFTDGGNVIAYIDRNHLIPQR